jgi:phosphoribosylpyrophosphate synthetase
MRTFKEFITEALRVNADNTVMYSTQSSRFGSSQEEIDTFPKLGMYHSNDAKYKGVEVFSCFVYKHSDVTTSILKAIKGQDGPYKMDEKTRLKFIQDAAKYAAKLVSSKKIDLILYPKSSSDLDARFVEEIVKLTNVAILPDAAVKKQIEIRDDNMQDMSVFLDVDNPDFFKLSTKSIKALEQALIRSVRKNQESGKGAEISLKDIYKAHGKFVKNFMDATTNLNEFVVGQNVLIVDDVASSGSTIMEMSRLAKEAGAKTVTALTLFKNQS